METKTDGGPAFPVADWDHQTFQPRTIEEAQRLLSGMTLRDYFAAKAMQGLLAQSMGSALQSDPDTGAQYAYRMADAMLAAREKS